MQTIPAVENSPPQINSAEFVRVTIYNEYEPTNADEIVVGNTYIILSPGTTDWISIGSSDNVAGTYFVAIGIGTGTGTANDVEVLTASSAYKNETIDGQVYSAVGGLMSVGGQQKDIRVTSADTTVALSGIQGTLINTVLSTKIRGSELEIWRGFYNTSGILTSQAKRFTGIITSYNVTEERSGLDDNFIVSVNASSYKTVLANRVAGRKTNPESWQFFNALDSAMNNIYSIATQTFDFGKEPTASGGGGGGGGRRDGGRQQQR